MGGHATMTDLGRDTLNHVILCRNIRLGCWEMVAGHRSRKHPITYYLKDEVEAVHDGKLVKAIPIDNAAAQQMMNDLWNGGLRPSEGVASTGQAESMQGEIKHLRGIVTRIINAEWSENDAVT